METQNFVDTHQVDLAQAVASALIITLRALHRFRSRGLLPLVPHVACLIRHFRASRFPDGSPAYPTSQPPWVNVVPKASVQIPSTKA